MEHGNYLKVFKFNDTVFSSHQRDIAGTFDAIWDRASIVALNREDVQK